MSLEISKTNWRGSCHLETPNEYRTPSFGTVMHPFMELDQFPPAGVSLTKCVRNMFVRGVYDEVDCADPQCGRREMRKIRFNLENDPQVILINLNRVFADNRNQTGIRRITDPVRIGGLLKLPFRNRENKYRLIGK